MEKQQKQYDIALKSKIMTGLAVRLLVAGYVVYLAYRILAGALGGGSPIPIWAAWLISIVFIAAAAGFGIYSWRQYRRGLKSAELPSDPQLSFDSAKDEKTGDEPDDR